MVEVFRTNVAVPDAWRLLKLLQERMPHHRITFDMEDSDRVLRIEGNNVQPGWIIDVLGANGYKCNVLD